MGVAQDKKWRVSDAYRFKGFSPQEGKKRGIFGKPQARILPLKRLSKKHAVENVAQYGMGGMTASAS